MTDHIRQTIADLQDELRQQEAAALDTKKLINLLCDRAGLPKLYCDQELQISGSVSMSIRSDQFYGQPLVTALREVLIMRRTLDQGPATINDLFASLIEGGFAFDTKNEDNAKRGLRISITKNSSVFHKLPNGKIGLLEWYPNAKGSKSRKGAVDLVVESANSTESVAGDVSEGEQQSDVTHHEEGPA